jgi:hypothetical protein
MQPLSMPRVYSRLEQVGEHTTELGGQDAAYSVRNECITGQIMAGEQRRPDPGKGSNSDVLALSWHGRCPPRLIVRKKEGEDRPPGAKLTSSC